MSYAWSKSSDEARVIAFFLRSPIPSSFTRISSKACRLILYIELPSGETAAQAGEFRFFCAKSLLNERHTRLAIVWF